MSIWKNKFFHLTLVSALLCVTCTGCFNTGDGSVYLYVDGSAAQIQNENGEVLRFADGQVTGELETLDIVSQSEDGFRSGWLRELCL